MPNRYHPLQPGDRTQGQSGLFENSPAADRRPASQSGFANPPGENAAPEFGEAETPLYKIGYLTPIAKHSAPFECVHTDGDTSGTGTKMYMIDRDEFGDCWDPTAPARVREVGSEWQVDSDGDGSKN
jgi:hypothetical protein